MENSSEINNKIFENLSSISDYNYLEQVDWIIPVTINVVLTILTAWMLISLIHYGIKTGKWRALHIKSMSEKLDVGFIYTSVVVCAVICLNRLAISLAFMNVGFNDDQDGLCESVADASYWAYGLVVYVVIYFLWFRQRVFYTNRMMNVNYGIPIRFVSFSSIIFLSVFGLFVLIYNTFPKNYYASHQGCIYKPTDTNPITFWILAIAIIMCSHLCMLGLLVFALLQTLQVQKKFFSKVEPAGRNENGSSRKSGKFSTTKQIKLILQKTLAFSIISIACDIFIQMFAEYIVPIDGHRRLSYMVFDLNAFLNLVFVILSFVRYKELLLSPLQKQEESLSSFLS